MHRRWEVSLLGVGMERSRRLYHSWGMCAGARIPLCEQLLSLPITVGRNGCVISVTPII